MNNDMTFRKALAYVIIAPIYNIVKITVAGIVEICNDKEFIEALENLRKAWRKSNESSNHN